MSAFQLNDADLFSFLLKQVKNEILAKKYYRFLFYFRVIHVVGWHH